MTGRRPGGRHATLSEFETVLATDEAIWREAEWGEMSVGDETYLQDYDDAALLEGHPDDRCQCPHWGHLLVGRRVVRYGDHEEVVEAGDVCYMDPGHSIAVDAGTVLVEFSPLEESQRLIEHVEEKTGGREETMDTGAG